MNMVKEINFGQMDIEIKDYLGDICLTKMDEDYISISNSCECLITIRHEHGGQMFSFYTRLLSICKIGGEYLLSHMQGDHSWTFMFNPKRYEPGEYR